MTAERTRRRRNLLFWLAFALFAGTAGAVLFLSEPLFLREAGVKASLLERAAGLRGLPPARVTGEAGKMLKAYLDASKPVNRVETEIAEASAERLAFTLLLPWAEVDPKKQRQRAESVARLAAEMLQAAGAGGAAVLVRVRRFRKDSTESDPVGSYVHRPAGGGFEWREGGA